MEGMIYRVQPYQEHARLLFVYTHIGKITLIARGSQKLNASSRVIAQFLTEISFQEVPHKTMYTLKEPKLINDYHHIKDDYHMTQQAALMLEIIDKFVVEDAKHEFIYEELMKALNAPSLDVSSLGFALRMLQSLGVGLSLKPDGRVIRGVNIEKGGLVYQDDDDDMIDIDVKEAIILLKLYYLPYNEHGIYEIDTLKAIKIFIQKYYQYHLQTTLKNLK